MEQLGMYSRQETLELNVPREIAIIGAGGVGAWVAIMMAMSGTEVIHLFDSDILEVHNLNRVPVSPNMVMMPKTMALQDMIRRLRPDVRVFTYDHVKQEDLEMLATMDSIEKIFDCTDSFRIQKLTAEYLPADKRIRVGYDGGESITVTDEAPPTWGDQTDEGYRVVPTWVAGAAMAGVLACIKACKYGDINKTIELSDFRRND